MAASGDAGRQRLTSDCVAQDGGDTNVGRKGEGTARGQLEVVVCAARTGSWCSRCLAGSLVLLLYSSFAQVLLICRDQAVD